jgi:flagella basal body P-ring formation protein FlgA
MPTGCWGLALAPVDASWSRRRSWAPSRGSSASIGGRRHRRIARCWIDRAVLWGEIVLDAVRGALIAAGAQSDCDVALTGFTPPLVPEEADPRPVVSDLDYDADAGRFSAVLSVAGKEMDPIHMRVIGRVDDTMDVPVATTRLAAGSVLRAEDVHMARVRVDGLRGDVAHRPGDAVGMQLRRQIAPGQPLELAELMRPALVQKDAIVLMVLDSPGIALTAQGQAMEAGAIGERIRVLNPASHAVIEAEVIGPGRVRVAPGASPVSVSER